MPNVHINGLRFNYFDDDFVDPWQPRDVVMINHYGYGSARLYYKWVPLLAQEYRVLRFDRRGFGDSETPPYPYEPGIADIMGDFVAFLNALAIDKVHFVGDRFGGPLGAIFAATHPERVRTLTMIASPYDGNRLKGIHESGAASVYREGSWLDAHKAWAAGAVDAAKGSPERALQALFMREQMAKIAPHVLAAHRRLSAEPSFTLAGILKDIQAPTLILSPDNAAPLVKMEEQEMMCRAIPNCEQVVVRDADRDFAYTQAQRCAAEVLRFLRVHSPAGLRVDDTYDGAKSKRQRA